MMPRLHNLATVWIVALIFVVSQPNATLAQTSEAVTEVPGWLGVELKDLTLEEANTRGWLSPRGVKVVRPLADSPAAAAGLMQGDVLVTLDGQEISSAEGFRAAIRKKGAGATIRLRFLRSGGEHELAVALAARPSDESNSTPAEEFLRLYNRVAEGGGLEQQIPLIEAALRLEPQINPWPLSVKREVLHSALLAKLGDAYYHQRRQNRAENLERAITNYEAAIAVLTREAAPEMWGMIQNNLATAYSDRVRGDREENLERAISAHEAALLVRAREAFPKEWAATQSNLAAAFLQRIRGDRAENLERAISLLEAALTVRIREQFPKEWAGTHHNLAYAYHHRIVGNHAENLERAIAAYRAALTVYTREDFPRNWADSENNLATVYAERILGERAQNLERAIAGFEAALSVRTREALPHDWAETQHNLAEAYHNRIRGDRAENVERAIEAFEAALTVRTREAFPRDWAETQNNLANACLDRIRGDHAENMERAVDGLKAALTVRTREAFPLEWALTQNNLGIAFSHRVRGDHADNLERAIAAFDAALAVHTRESSPREWARLQHNLANTFRARIRGDHADNLERAIAGFEAALTVYTRESFPQNWAETQSDLAIVYRRRVHGDNEENLERAIAAYAKALTVHTREAFPQDWATIQNNLAAAYSDRVRDREENLERAIAANEAALTVRTREAFPEMWAATQDNLGSDYWKRIRGDRAENIERSIAAHEGALTVYTQETFPEDWAMTQNNLAVAYHDRVQGDREKNIERSIAAYEAALKVYTLDAYPRDHLRVKRAIGKILLEKGLWRQAEEAFVGARRAFLLLFGQGLNDGEAKDLIDHDGSLFSDAAYVAARAGETVRALELLDEGKARMLSVSLKLNTLSLAASERERLETLRRQIREGESAYARAERMEPTEKLTGMGRTEKLVAIEHLRGELLELLDKAEDQSRLDRQRDVLTAAAKVAPEGGAIIAPILTSVGGMLLIITVPDGNAKIRLVDLPQFDSARLEELVSGSNGWFAAYPFNASSRKQTREHQQQFRDAIDDIGHKLWSSMGQLLAEALDAEGVKHGASIIVLPQGELGVLPLGLAQDIGNRFRLGDLYEIHFAPNINALQREDLLATTAPPALAMTVNPEDNLPFAALEGEFVSSRFDKPRQTKLEKTAATPQAVLEALGGKTYWHFASHGAFSLEDARLSELTMAGGQPLTVAMLLETRGLGKPRLVVLSACETGLYDFIRRPNEFIGLPSAFMALGAKGVLSALWKVDDAATALLMARFYDLHLDEGLRPAMALKRAQEWLRAASESDLAAYVERAVAQGRITADWPQTLKDSIAGVTIIRSRADDRRQPSEGASQAAAPGKAGSAPPFAHPYYWGGFIFTGR